MTLGHLGEVLRTLASGISPLGTRQAPTDIQKCTNTDLETFQNNDTILSVIRYETVLLINVSDFFKR